jgi:hypothetical protein
VTRLAEERVLLNSLTLVLGFWGVVLGTLTILGGGPRWRSPVFETALLLPGAPESWGVILATAGALLLVGWGVRHSGRPVGDYLVAAGYLGGFLWTGFFGFALGVVALHNPEVAMTASVTYWALSAICGLLLIYGWRWRV